MNERGIRIRGQVYVNWIWIFFLIKQKLLKDHEPVWLVKDKTSPRLEHDWGPIYSSQLGMNRALDINLPFAIRPSFDTKLQV